MFRYSENVKSHKIINLICNHSKKVELDEITNKIIIFKVFQYQFIVGIETIN